MKKEEKVIPHWLISGKPITINNELPKAYCAIEESTVSELDLKTPFTLIKVLLLLFMLTQHQRHVSHLQKTTVNALIPSQLDLFVRIAIGTHLQNLTSRFVSFVPTNL